MQASENIVYSINVKLSIGKRLAQAYQPLGKSLSQASRIRKSVSGPAAGYRVHKRRASWGVYASASGGQKYIPQDAGERPGGAAPTG
jgi:hypothetical protein